MQEPGLDQRAWQTRWEALEPDLADAPAEALSEVDRLVEEMLDEQGHGDDIDPEVERELGTARGVVTRIEAGEEVDPGDVRAAAAAFRTVYEQLIAERRSL